MNRTVLLVVGWLGATLLSMAIAWAAVAGVREQVTDRPSALATTTVVAMTPTTEQPGSTAPRGTDSTVPAASTSVATTATEPMPVSTAASSSTTVPVTTTPPDTSTPSVTSTTQPRPTTTTTTSTTTTTTAAPADEWESSTHRLLGGTVRIRSRPGQVRLVAVVPEPGFTAEIDDEGPERVKVEFESENRESSFEAEWEGGELEIRIEEDD